MKKIISALTMLLAFTVCVQAQDLITKRDGEDIKAKITEVNQNEIKYKRFDNQDGPTFVISKSEVLMVRYENGTNEVFNQQPATAPTNNYVPQQQQTMTQANYNAQQQPAAYGNNYGRPMDYGTAGKVYPGMRYKHYKNFYEPSAYIPQSGDKYSPALGGVCSWIIPGLGQMICGEVGRGCGYLGGTIISGVVMGVGTGLLYDYPILGSIFAIAGSVSLLTVDICAIVDGVRVAKVKNMYNQDMRNMSSSIDMHLYPYLSTINTGTVRTPVAGVSLGINF